MVLFLTLDRVFYDKRNTFPVWDMIQDSEGKELDILFMGNSHAFTSVNPILINEALKIKTVVLGSSAQPMELTYANLKVLLQYKKPKAIVLEANTLVTTVDELCKQGREGNLYTNIDAIRNPFYRACMVAEVLDYRHWLEGFSQLFRPMLAWKRLANIHSQSGEYGNLNYANLLGFLPKEGAYVKTSVNLAEREQKNIAETKKEKGIATGESTNTTSISYLHKFLQLTDRENIPVYIIKAPVARAGYVEFMKEVERISLQHKSVKGVYNYNTQLTSIGLTVEDFFDSGHLNRVGAGKFTVFLTDKIGKKLNRKPDYSKVCYYKDEALEKLSNGLYRYRIDTFPNSLIRFVVKDGKGKVLRETPYSQTNYIDMKRIGFNRSLYFNIKPVKYFPETISPEQTNFKFMKDKGVFENYDLKSLDIKLEGNVITVKNNYRRVPVYYTYVVYQNNKKLKEYPYSEQNVFSYKFKDPGKYMILAYVKTKDKLYDDRKSLKVPVSVIRKGDQLVLKVQ